MFKNILAVCVGNICRSPVVEYLIRNDPLISESGCQVSSAGLAALRGHPADQTALELMKERGIDLSPHHARQLTVDLLMQSDLVLVMEFWQQREIERLYPVARGKVTPLGRWQSVEIPDPYKKPRQEFEKVFALIERSLSDWKRKLW